MNSSKIEPEILATALGRLDAWLETMRAAGGYYGPAVGFRGVSMAYCGPGHDWRWEGLLDGWAERHARTGEPLFLARMEQALRDLAAAQLLNGAFRNSSFENNPVEGGMPHEPAVMAAAIRACNSLTRAGRRLPEGTTAMLERFVEERLIRELWNKLLKTFNNWLQSDFETYAPPAVASILEVLLGYAELTGDGARLEPYVRGAADSLLASQFASGPLAGGLPVSNRDGASASPYLAARCLPALAWLQRRTGETRWTAATDALVGFLGRSATAKGGFPFLIHARRPAAVLPVFTGAAAGTLVALHRAGRLTEELVAAHLPFVLARQTASGAFETAVGGNRRSRVSRRPDWRDVVPVVGWADKIYHLLAILNAGTPVPAAGAAGAVQHEVKVLGVDAVFCEDDHSMRLAGRTRTWFEWRKGTVWPSACELS